MMMLENKVAIITGSTSGIGEAAAKTLAKHGAKVLVTGRDAERGEAVVAEIHAGGGEALFVPANLMEPEAPASLAQAALDQWGRIDIIVNNAAMVCNKPMEDVTHEDWNRLFAVNVKAAFFLIQAALPQLRANKGCVVNVSSINGMRNDFKNLVYDTMKAALNHMTTGIALDLRKDGVRCNVLMPGGVATPLIDAWLSQVMTDPEEMKKTSEAVKMDPSVGQPQQIADGILFLVSGLASWVNGSIIPIDGGFHVGYPEQ